MVEDGNIRHPLARDLEKRRLVVSLFGIRRPGLHTENKALQMRYPHHPQGFPQKKALYSTICRGFPHIGPVDGVCAEGFVHKGASTTSNYQQTTVLYQGRGGPFWGVKRELRKEPEKI